MSMRGSLELSLNALVTFIVSVIILGFGIWLIGVFIDTGVSVIAAPDYCRGELNNAIAQGDRFVLCPDAIPSTEFSHRRIFEVHYAFYNDADVTTLGFGVNTTNPKFEIQPNALRDVGARESGRGVFLIRLKPGEDPERIERVRIHLCPLVDETDPSLGLDCDSLQSTYGTDADPLISRVLTINT